MSAAMPRRSSTEKPASSFPRAIQPHSQPPSCISRLTASSGEGSPSTHAGASRNALRLPPASMPMMPCIAACLRDRSRIRSRKFVTVRDRESTGPALAPGLEHQDVPQEVLPVAAAGQMFVPASTDQLRVEQAALPKPLLREQVLRPVAQRPLQPFRKRNAETHLGPFDQLPRHMPVEH